MQSFAQVSAFCAAHPVNYLDAEVFGHTLTTLVSGPEAVIDIFEGDERVVFANVLDCAEVDGAVISAIVGARELPSDVWAAAAEVFVDAAERVAASAGRKLIVSWRHPVPPTAAAVLHRQGYAVYLRELSMERAASAPRVATPVLPDAWRFALLGSPMKDACIRLVLEAFEGSGWPLPMPDALEKQFFGPEAPPPWGLFDGDRLIGVARVVHDDDGTVARIGPIARAPGYVGRGLGALLTAQAIASCRPGVAVRLDVLSDNVRAIRLYRRFGFEDVIETGWYRRAAP